MTTKLSSYTTGRIWLAVSYVCSIFHVCKRNEFFNSDFRFMHKQNEKRSLETSSISGHVSRIEWEIVFVMDSFAFSSSVSHETVQSSEPGSELGSLTLLTFLLVRRIRDRLLGLSLDDVAGDEEVSDSSNNTGDVERGLSRFGLLLLETDACADDLRRRSALSSGWEGAGIFASCRNVLNISRMLMLLLAEHSITWCFKWLVSSSN